MNSSKKKIIAFAMSVTVFSTPFMAAAPCYADPQLEQITPQKQNEQTSGNNGSFTERLKKKQAAIQASTIPAGTKFAAKVANNTDLKTTLKDLPNAMNPSKPHGVSITIQ